MITLQTLNGIDVTEPHYVSKRMVIGEIGMIFWCKSVRNLISSEKSLSLNSTIRQAGCSYGIFLGPFLCLKIILFTIQINSLTSLYSEGEFFNNITLHSMSNFVSFGKLHSFYTMIYSFI